MDEQEPLEEKPTLAEVFAAAGKIKFKFSDDFWKKINEDNKRLNEQAEREEKSLRMSWKRMNTPFDM